MTEPLIVDPDVLAKASNALRAAATNIPVGLPKFSVTGTDALSMAIAAGAVKVEEPMAALPGIKANAITIAESIGVAGKRYRETDEMLAQKAKQQQFDKDNADAARGTHGGGIGKYKASPVFGKDLPTPPDDPSGQKSVTDTLLSNMADGGTAKTSVNATITDMGTKIAGSKTDWILGTGGALSSKLGDGVAELTRAGSPENKWVGKAVEEIKLFGSEVKGSRLGGLVGSLFSAAAFAKDTGQENMPPVHAFVRESTAFVAGTVAGGPLKLSIVGAPLGMAIGGVASNATAYVMDTFYEMGKGVADAGGPGAVLRVARWGQPPM